MEYFFQRLVAYIKVRPTPAMTNVIVKIMVEVISILGVVTKEVGQGQISMPFLIIISPEVDVSRREVSQEVVWLQSCRGRASTAGQINARGSSYGSSRNPDGHSRN